MALKDKWIDKKDNVDDILAEDINNIAKSVIEMEDELPKISALPEVTEDDNGKTLMVDNGQWKVDIGTQPDYSQNNPESGNYIKNRPFYKETRGVDIAVFPETPVSFNTGATLVQGFASGFFIEGNKYIVKWKGKEYEAHCYVEDDTFVIGNGALANMTTETDHPFCIVSFGGSACYVYKNTDAVETITMKVDGVQEVIYHKIPKEYLPDDIGGGSAELDPEIFKKDVIIPETSLTLTERGSGSETNIHSDISVEIGKTYIVNWNGIKYSCIAKEDDDGRLSSVVLGYGGIFGLPVTDEPFGIRFANERYNLTENVMIYSVDGLETVTVEVTTPQTIDPKYIPDMYYTEERQDVEILPTSTAINTGVSVMGEKYVIGDAVALVEGKTYKVTYNGVEYESIASVVTIQSINDGIGLGDVGILTTGSPSGNYPFVLIVTKAMAEQGASVAVISLDGSSSITVSIVGYGEITHKIPEKYLPDNALAGTINIETGMSALLEDREVRYTRKELVDRVREVARNCDKMLLIGDNNGISTELLLTKTQKLGIGDNNAWEFGGMFSLISDETTIPCYISLRVNDTEDIVEIKVTALTPAN